MWMAFSFPAASGRACCVPSVSLRLAWKRCATEKAGWARVECAPSCARPSWPVKRARTSPSRMGGMHMPSPGPLSARLELTSRRSAESLPMATSARTPASTREKLLRAKDAAARLAQLTVAQKNELLLAMAAAIELNAASIIEANQFDLSSSGLAEAMRDRLLLNQERVAAMASGVREVASLADPIGETLAEWSRPNGLRIRKVRVPLGVVGVIYESRPNVTADTVSLALKSGNAIVLRGGKEAAHSNERLVEILSAVPGVPTGAIELLDSTSRDSVNELIKARGLVDVLIPRGGPGLFSFVTENATVPVIETGAGNCHIFVDESADFEMADRIVINAKTQRPSVCNAAEKLLVHQNIAAEYVPRIVKKLLERGVEVRGDGETRRLAAEVSVRPAENK